MAGIYIHIPFCKQKCSYCDFHFSTTYKSYQKQMIDCLEQEIITRKTYLKDQIIETIYFGGGTPSLLSKDEINQLINTIKNEYQVIKNPEITLEANPDDISTESLQYWKECGINRLSIGLQSFREEDLIWMNRAHSREESLNCIDLAKQSGFDNISVDLIYGLPNFTLEDWKTTIQTVINFGIQHVSAYCLTVENKTALSKWVEIKKIIPANEDEQSDQFEMLVEELAKVGIEQYEISNFSLPNYESNHNSNYWKAKHYLGIGPSAHSFNGVSRSWNISNNREYLKALESNSVSYIETENLTTKDRFNELLLIGLRTNIGVDLNQLKSIALPSESFWKRINELKEQNWLLEINNTIRLTKSGKLKADYISSELFM
jgi:oxygen-independent coproporphyrinogen-3 oxidase